MLVALETVFDKLVGHRPVETVADGANLWKPLDAVLDEVDPVPPVLHSPVERGADGAFLSLAACQGPPETPPPPRNSVRPDSSHRSRPPAGVVFPA